MSFQEMERKSGYKTYYKQEKARLLQTCPFLSEKKATGILKKQWRQLIPDEKQVFVELELKQGEWQVDLIDILCVYTARYTVSSCRVLCRVN